jgi:hypothetical protein
METVNQIRSFNAAGIERFEALLLSIENGAADPSCLDALRYDPELTEVLVTDVEIPVGPFTRKFDVGMAVLSAVSSEQAEELLRNDDVWPWLSVVFRQSLFVHSKKRGLVGDFSRHVVQALASRDSKARHRHLVRGAVNMIVKLGPDVEFLMGAPDQHVKFEEQIMSRTERTQLASSREFAHAVARLYVDPVKKKTKPGSKGTGAGNIVRLIKVRDQLELNHDVDSLTADELIAMLPDEFNKFRKAA